MIKIPIFIYHHVFESRVLASKNMQVTPKKFEQQMRFLFKKGFHCLSLSDYVTNWLQGISPLEHSFVLTFDDGYIDNYEIASPILKKFGFTATIFVVVKSIEEKNNRYLSWSEMKELAHNQFTFGSHTMTHPRLNSLENMAVEHELDDSKKIIEDRLGEPVLTLAYPYGESNERVQDIACKSGYQAACGLTVGHPSLHNLWRVPIKEHESELSFYWKSYNGYYLYTWLREETFIGRKMRAYKRYLFR